MAAEEGGHPCHRSGFILKDYFSFCFRLNLPGELIEDGRECASYDIDKGELLIKRLTNLAA